MLKEILNSSFDGIEFEPVEHKYTVEGQELTPVSNTLKDFYEEFDTDQKAIEYAERHGGDPEEIAQRWRQTGIDACAFGTAVHDFGERFFSDSSLQPSNNHEEAVVSFWKDLTRNKPYILKLAPELQVFSVKLRTAGTIDILLYDQFKQGVIIADYKTNKDLYKNFMGKTMYEPFEFLLDMPLSHYELQLSTYQVLLEEAGIKVVDRWIIWLKPDGTYENIQGRDFSVKIKEELLNKTAC